jgi:diguanylate cyclase (GGDEF)-like protein
MHTPRRICLGVDLSSELAAQLLAALPESYALERHTVSSAKEYMESIKTENQSGPAFIPSSVWAGLSLSERRELVERSSWQWLLIADTQTSDVLEFIAGGSFLTLITCPVDKEKISHALMQAAEIADMYRDIRMMAREITLERELLTRKNEQLAFLNQLLTRASQTLDPTLILANCAEDLNLLFPVNHLMGVFWGEHEGRMEAEIFLPENIADVLQEQWITHLLSVAGRYAVKDIHSYQISFLPARRKNSELPPEQDQIFTQPLRSVDGTVFGALVINSDEAQSLGRDRVQAMHAAANHLALAIRNGLEFRKVKACADRDSLTHVANRRKFDIRLREEMKRHQRHQDELSLLMLDLDYFKAINDTYGHQAGDIALRKVGKILCDTLRESDFPARYGGEEFVVILPQTREEQAWMLAERLRKAIEKTSFRFGKKNFRVTASIGIASLMPGTLEPPEALLQKADEALYRAKANGRNMVCASAIEETAIHV